MNRSYPIYLKTMVGDLLTIEYNPSEGWGPVRDALGPWLNVPAALIRFLPQDHVPNEHDLVCVFVDETRLCFNRTAGEYFPFADTSEYNIKLAHLLTLLTHTPIHAQDRGASRWKPTDHILLVPPHLTTYVETNYNQICF